MKYLIIISIFLYCLNLKADSIKIDTIHWDFERWTWKLKDSEKWTTDVPKNLNHFSSDSFSFYSQLNFDNDGNILFDDESIKKFLFDKEIIFNKDYPDLDGKYNMKIDAKAKIINKIIIYFDKASLKRTALRSFELPKECEIFNSYNKVNVSRLNNGKDRLILGNADFGRAIKAIKICDKSLYKKIKKIN